MSNNDSYNVNNVCILVILVKRDKTNIHAERLIDTVCQSYLGHHFTVILRICC